MEDNMGVSSADFFGGEVHINEINALFSINVHSNVFFVQFLLSLLL